MNPKIIKSEEDYNIALNRIEEIFDAKPGSPEFDEMELLVKLVEIYEDEKYPISAPDPISAIKFRMEQQGLKSKDLIPYIGSKSKVSEVLSGKRALSLNMIRKLNEGLGIPAEVLIKETGKTLPDSSIMKHGINFPFTEMFRRGWFKDFYNGTLNEAKELKEELIIKFIGLFNINDFAISYNRKSESQAEPENINDILMAWRIRVMNKAITEKLPAWNKEVLTDEFFFELAKLSYFQEGPKLAKEFLNKAGIHFVIEQHLDKTHLDGSSMLMPDGSPLIALTLRYDRLDSFWFTLFHELAHVQKHLTEIKMAYFDDMFNEMNKKIEKEADAYAKQMLIQDSLWKSSGLRITSSTAEIKAFASQIRINPAIPAGRLRYENKNYSVFTNLIGNGAVREMFK
ncbi:MAG: ImmA/IrrE family metallo-endopeptidase [Treponema sp.]|nr:ImmA/IrrE family metallo-endopeptidase [Treponema sp.]MBP3607084.1 ImmA/IrrE family metallo-endopeptidase [Treponema sp.]